jgi:hypothetical protein
MNESITITGAARAVRSGDVVERIGGKDFAIMEVLAVSQEGEEVVLRGRREKWRMNKDKKLRFVVIDGHLTSPSRRKLGRGVIKGAGIQYGSALRCSCGYIEKMNDAPSRVMRSMEKGHLESALAQRMALGIEDRGLSSVAL